MDVLSYVCCALNSYPNYIFVQYEKRSFRFFDVALTLGVLLLTIFLTIKYLS
jgi:hypothetical protein